MLLSGERSSAERYREKRSLATPVRSGAHETRRALPRERREPLLRIGWSARRAEWALIAAARSERLAATPAALEWRPFPWSPALRPRD